MLILSNFLSMVAVTFFRQILKKKIPESASLLFLALLVSFQAGQGNIGSQSLIPDLSQSATMVKQVSEHTESLEQETEEDTEEISREQEEQDEKEKKEKEEEEKEKKKKGNKDAKEKLQKLLETIIEGGDKQKKPKETKEIVEEKKEIKEKIGAFKEEEDKEKAKVAANAQQQQVAAAVQTLAQTQGGQFVLSQIGGLPQITDNPFYGKAVPETHGLLNSKNEIVVGTTCPMSGGVSLIGRDISYGIDLIFNKLNPQGGIGGNLIRIKTLDSENDVVIAEKNITTLSETTPAFLGVFGSEVVASVLPEIKEQQLFMVFPTAGDMAFREKDLRYAVHFRAPVQNEISALLTYAVTKLHRRKVGIFYEDSRWGEEGLRQAEQVLETLGYKAYVKASYPENTVEVVKAVRIIADKSPNVVLCISHARPTYNFILQGLKKGLKSCKFLGLGEMVPIQEILQKSRGVELLTSSVVPSPFKSDLPLVAQYRQDMAKFYANKSMSQFFLEGYTAAWIFSECLKQIPPPYTIGNIIGKIESLKNMDFGGLNLNFDPDSRTLCSDVWINIGKNKPWPIFKQAKKKPEKKDKKKK